MEKRRARTSLDSRPDFIVEPSAPDRLAAFARTGWIATLDHEALDISAQASENESRGERRGDEGSIYRWKSVPS